MHFPIQMQEIDKRIDSINPLKYAKTRNYISGHVSYLSPYISRGVISTKEVARRVLSNGYSLYDCTSFIKELAWRDYFQQVWIAKGNVINQDMKQAQPNTIHNHIPEALVHATTGIEAIDTSIKELYQIGYMHNHVRMYTASLACNFAGSHWLEPARWMYYHLLDADWASNALSWQWVAGSFSHKQYIMNQQNVNTYCGTTQRNTFLDKSYEDLDLNQSPPSLSSVIKASWHTELPQPTKVKLDASKPLYIYNFYNLDSRWDAAVDANRILLLEPSFFSEYPVANHTIRFILDLAHNIPHIQVAVLEFDELHTMYASDTIHYKEHPTCIHYKGMVHEREFLFPDVTGYYPSFSAYWRQCEKRLKQLKP